MSQDEFKPLPDVRWAAYIRGGCPGCGRHRLEVFVDGPEDNERAVGIRCEKCYRQWLLNPEAADFHSDHSDNDPLNPQPPEQDPFGGGT